jgi:hypothetical protein
LTRSKDKNCMDFHLEGILNCQIRGFLLGDQIRGFSLGNLARSNCHQFVPWQMSIMERSVGRACQPHRLENSWSWQRIEAFRPVSHMQRLTAEHFNLTHQPCGNPTVATRLGECLGMTMLNRNTFILNMMLWFHVFNTFLSKSLMSLHQQMLIF